MMRFILRGVAVGVLLCAFAVSGTAQSNPAAFNLAGGNYSFTQWPSSSAALTYPTSMVFHTFTDRIEFGNLDQDPVGDWVSGYNLTSRARITGEGTNGFAFHQTTSTNSPNAFMGAAVLALNTTGRGNVNVSFTAAAFGTFQRPYAVRLQIRLGTSGPWQNCEAGGAPVQHSASVEGTTAKTYTYKLPLSAENKPLVQLRWLYFQDGDGSGSRPSIRVDDISVTSDVFSGSPVMPAYATTTGSLLHAYAGAPMRPFTIRVYNADNNIDLAYNGTVTISQISGPGALSGTLSVVASQGQATFTNVIPSTVGNITLRATAPNISNQVLSTVVVSPTPVITQTLTPQNIYGRASTSSGFHTPAYSLVTLTNLAPNTKYRYVTGVGVTPATYPTSAGPGFNLNYDATTNNYTFTGGKSVTNEGDYSFFTTGDAETSKVLWLNLVPTISDEFQPGNTVYWQVSIADGGGNVIRNYQLGQTSVPMTNTTDNTGATLIGERNSQLGEKNFVVLWDNTAGTGRPLGISIVQSYNAVANFSTTRYRDDIENKTGSWMTQIPNTLAGGVRRIEERSWKTGQVVWSATSTDGNWNSVSTNPYTNGPGSFFSPIYLNTPTVRVTYPTAGDTLCAGQIYTITYRADGMQNVMLEYSVDNGASYTTIVGSTPAADGRYDWAVPSSGFQGNCYIRITGVDQPSQTARSGKFAVVEPLQMVEPLLSKNLCLGQTDTLIALVAGSVESYTWYKDGVAIPLATGPILLLQNVQYNSGGVYWCEVNGYGTCGDVVTNQAHVRVARPTKIVTQTFAVPGIIGETVSMSVQAEFPNEVLSYQWYKGQTMLTDNGHYYGTASSRLEIRDFAQNDFGNDYYCMVVGVCGTVNSRVVRVFPTGVYVEFVNPTVSVCGNNDVEVKADVYSNPDGEDLMIQWYRNGQPLTEGAVYQGVTTSTLTIKNASAALAGDYTVKAYLTVEPALAGEATATVVIATPPTITGQPASSDVCEGASVTLSVNVNAQGTVTYQWYQDGTEVPGATDATYEITSATAVRAGQYTVEITTACGTITSDAATVTVNPATMITTQPEATVDVQVAGTLTLTVAATGSGTIQYQWFKDGTELTGEVAATYTKANVANDDAGQYWCRVQSECGEVLSDTATVTIRPVVSVNEDVIAGGVTINRVAPNPIHATANVQLTLPSAATVQMNLVDASGQVVATIANGLMTAGTHELEINAAPVASGMYMLQTIVGGARHLQTVMVVK